MRMQGTGAERERAPTMAEGQQRTSPTIELLYCAECPHHHWALTAVRAVRAAQGITAPVALVAVASQADAERLDFYGSPTIRVDGVDIVPPLPNAHPALACRIYRTSPTGFAPVPPAAVIAAALQRR